MDVLFLCTGNICRSPAAEALLRGRLESVGIGAAVRSAGLLEGGHPASAGSVHLLAARGLDLSGHRSRMLTAKALRAADLVLGMAREHVREAVVLVPGAWPKAFTLKELVRRGEAVGPRRADQPLARWLAEAAADRTPSELLGASLDDDIADPFGFAMPAYERMVAELEDLLDRLVRLLWAQLQASRP